MAFTSIKDAQAANDLARFLLPELPGNGSPLPSPEKARDALAHLLDMANAKYGAGLNGKPVRAAWDRAAPTPAALPPAATGGGDGEDEFDLSDEDF
ncbi:hypothetical protein [Actinomadura yumaensis]|uniref:Uncharacterized protein n=1 Tax=Actinomadura yumaensis TaxID=111807 RepID=A0ABW2CS37_9ACTN